MINFLKYRWICAFFSIILFGVLGGAYVYKWMTRGYTFVYSVDFTGGTQVLFSFKNAVNGEKVLSLLEKAGWSGAIARDFSPTEILVRVKEFSDDPQGLAQRMRDALVAAMPENDIEIMQTDSVGAGVGAEMRAKSTYAVIIALILMLLYIAFRFLSFAFAAGAFISLLHDAIIVLAIFLLFDKEISMNVIGAILTVLGYSINDTIVIFARIRENMRKLRTMPIEDIVNLSINEALRRTILTTFATLLVVVALLIFGGETLRTLSVALLIGMTFGVYSTIYIASPVMLLFYKEKR